MTLNIQPGVAVSGQAVSDVVHLLAEIIENATVFSPKDTQVRVSAQELASGGVLIEVSDSGVGVSDARLAEMNHRLDDPPVIDESVSRHMGLFAVSRLAERNGVRVRLRAGSPQGLTALVWLPDSLAERGTRPYSGWSQPPARQADPSLRRAPGRHSIVMRPGADGADGTDGQYTNGWPDAVALPTQTDVSIPAGVSIPAALSAPTGVSAPAALSAPPGVSATAGVSAPAGDPPRPARDGARSRLDDVELVP